MLRVLTYPTLPLKQLRDLSLLNVSLVMLDLSQLRHLQPNAPSHTHCRGGGAETGCAECGIQLFVVCSYASAGQLWVRVQACTETYGFSAEVVCTGNLRASIPYIPVHIDYMCA